MLKENIWVEVSEKNGEEENVRPSVNEKDQQRGVN